MFHVWLQPYLISIISYCTWVVGLCHPTSTSTFIPKGCIIILLHQLQGCYCWYDANHRITERWSNGIAGDPNKTAHKVFIKTKFCCTFKNLTRIYCSVDCSVFAGLCWGFLSCHSSFFLQLSVSFSRVLYRLRLTFKILFSLVHSAVFCLVVLGTGCHPDKDEPHTRAMLFLWALCQLCMESSLSLVPPYEEAVHTFGDTTICFPLGSRSFISFCPLADIK